jgi:hypothetical protein
VCGAFRTAVPSGYGVSSIFRSRGKRKGVRYNGEELCTSDEGRSASSAKLYTESQCQVDESSVRAGSEPLAAACVENWPWAPRLLIGDKLSIDQALQSKDSHRFSTSIGNGALSVEE